MLGYLMDINVDEYPVILKSSIRFLFFSDILAGYYNEFLNKNKNNQNRQITNSQITRIGRY